MSGPWEDFQEQGPWEDFKPKETSHLQGIKEGISEPLYNVMERAEGLMTKAGIDRGALQRFGEFVNPGHAAPSIEMARARKMAEWRKNAPLPSGAGKFVGNAVGSTAIAAPLGGGVAVQGALQAATLTRNEGLPFVRDVLTGAIGAKVGDKVLKGAANLISPTINKSVRTLAQKKIPMMMGQVTPWLKSAEDKLTSYPFVGAMIERGRDRSVEGLNKAWADDVLTSIGEGVPETVPLGNQMVKYVGDRVSAGYKSVLPKISLSPDDAMKADFSRIGSETRASGQLTAGGIKKFEKLIGAQVFDRLKGPAAGGDKYKAVDSNLGQIIADHMASSSPEDRAIGRALQQAQTALSEAVHRQNPDASASLKALDQAWSKLVPLESAASKAKGGIASPEQLRAAVRQSNRTVRKRGVARGEARMQELSDAASDILPSGIGNSRTADRLNMSPLRPEYWMGMALSPLYRQNVQRGLTNMLVAPRPKIAKPTAELIKRIPGGYFVPPLLVGGNRGE